MRFGFLKMMDTSFFTSIADEISDRGWFLPWEGFPQARAELRAHLVTRDHGGIVID